MTPGQLQDPRPESAKQHPVLPRPSGSDRWGHLSVWVPPQRVCCLGIRFPSTGHTALSHLLTDSATTAWPSSGIPEMSPVTPEFTWLMGTCPGVQRDPLSQSRSKSQRAHTLLSLGNLLSRLFSPARQPCSDRSGP